MRKLWIRLEWWVALKLYRIADRLSGSKDEVRIINYSGKPVNMNITYTMVDKDD